MTLAVERYEMREPPNDPKLVQAAAAQPGGWVYEIDWDYPENQRTPPEAICGGWEISPDGKFTGKYAVNPRYRPIQHSDRKLKPFMHAGARAYPSRWIVESDPRGEKLFPDIPEDLIRGWWYVDAEGKITNQFRPNSKWKPDPSADV